MTPTLTNLSKIDPNRRIWSTCDTMTQITMKIRMPVNTLMDPEDFISLYVL